MDAVQSYASRIRDRLTTTRLHAEGTLLLTGGMATFSSVCFALGYGTLSLPSSWERLAKVVDILRQRTFLIGFIVGSALGGSIGLCFGTKAIRETGMKQNQKRSFTLEAVQGLSRCVGLPIRKLDIEVTLIQTPSIPLLSALLKRAELKNGGSMKERLLHDLPRVATWFLLFVGVSGGMLSLDALLRNYSQGKIPWAAQAGAFMGGSAACSATFALLSLWPSFTGRRGREPVKL